MVGTRMRGEVPRKKGRPAAPRFLRRKREALTRQNGKFAGKTPEWSF